jgi:hypothetical protein
MPANRKVTQAQPADVPVNGNGQVHPEEVPNEERPTSEPQSRLPIDAPWIGNESVSFARLASRHHGQIRAQLAKEKPKEVVVRRPSGQEFIRVKPCREGRAPIALIKDERNRNAWYAVIPELESEFEDDITLGYVVEVMSNVKSDDGEQEYFLWVLPLQDHNGRDNDWWESWREIASIAETRWVKVKSGKRKAYPKDPTTEIPDPPWPEMSFDEAFDLAFKGRFLTTLQHPFAKFLRGGN